MGLAPRPTASGLAIRHGKLSRCQLRAWRRPPSYQCRDARPVWCFCRCFFRCDTWASPCALWIFVCSPLVTRLLHHLHVCAWQDVANTSRVCCCGDGRIDKRRIPINPSISTANNLRPTVAVSRHSLWQSQSRRRLSRIPARSRTPGTGRPSFFIFLLSYYHPNCSWLEI